MLSTGVLFWCGGWPTESKDVAVDQGCSGGMLDDAWLFLNGTGLPEESCDAYTHCPFPAHSSCTAPAPPASGHCAFTNASTGAGEPFLSFGKTLPLLGLPLHFHWLSFAFHCIFTAFP